MFCLVVIDEDRIGLDIVLISFGYLTLADEDRIGLSIELDLIATCYIGLFGLDCEVFSDED